MKLKQLSCTTAVAVFVALMVPMMSAPASAANSGHPAGWNTWCRFVKTTTDDPIVYPGQPGKAKKHDFLGNLTTNAYSTFDSLRAGETSCPLTPTEDRSAYWYPRMFINGKSIGPGSTFLFYWAPKYNTPDQVESIPPGMKMIGTHTKFSCGGKRIKAPRKVLPFDCTPYGAESRVVAYVTYPNCWNGQGTEPDDVVYRTPDVGCVAPYARVLPELTAEAIWEVQNGTGATFSTGDASTMTAEFFNGWDPSVMDQLIRDCMNNDKFCFSVQNGINRPPVINGAEIIPQPVYATGDLTAIANHPHDPNDWQTISLHYQWNVNDASVGGDSPRLGHGAFSVGDKVTVTITPVDSEDMAGLPVTSPASYVDNDVVCPKPSVPGGALTNVRGGGFGPKEDVALHVDSQGGSVIKHILTDGSGAFPAMDVMLPQDITGGTHQLVGVGATSGIVGSGPFSVTPEGTLSPNSLAAGDTATFSGDGYVPGDTLTFTFEDGSQETAVANGAGTVSIVLTSPELPGPSSEVTVSASNGTFSPFFNVLPTVTLSGSPEPGVPNDVTLTGFGKNEDVEAIVDDVNSGQKITTDGSGSGSGSITIFGTFGKHDLRMLGKISGVGKYTRLVLPAYVNVTPDSGPVGTEVTVSSLFGWVPGWTVTLRWAGDAMPNLTADSNGSVSSTFNVPQHAPGHVGVILTDTILGLSPSTSFTITTLRHLNAAPTINAAVIEGDNLTNVTFTGTAKGVNDPDGDPVTLHYAWTLNTQSVGSDKRTFSSPSLEGGDVLGLSIRPQDSHGNWGTSVAAPPITLEWEIQATQAQVGQKATKVGVYGFAPGELVDIKLDSKTSAPLTTVTVNSQGYLYSITVPIPYPYGGGVRTLYGVGRTSGIVGQGPITITPDAHLDPAALKATETGQLLASGFVPGETVSAWFPWGPVLTKTADATGSVKIAMVSPEEPYVHGIITVSAPSATVEAPFAALSNLALSTDTGEPGDRVTFDLTGFAAGEVVQRSWNGGTVKQTYVANEQGSVHSSFLVDGVFGHHRVHMRGVVSNNPRQLTFYIPPIMSVVPNPVVAGQQVEITSLSGWGPGDTVYLYWQKHVVEVLIADADGSINLTFNIPMVNPGIYLMKLSDPTLGISAKTKVTVVAG